MQGLASLDSPDTLDAFRIQHFGKKGALTQMLKELGALDPEARRQRGQDLNRLKANVMTALNARIQGMRDRDEAKKLGLEDLDVTLEGAAQPKGQIHPTSHTLELVTAIFGDMGFSVVEGPEIEEDSKNFDALNIPEDHPARQEQDTFYLPRRSDGQKMVLRTHTSPVQIRTMMETEPPIQIIAPGRTFRSDHDVTHTPMFHQVEGLYIGKGINMGHLKGCLTTFLRAFFEMEDLPIRFRPSYFPFTEPSAEVDIGCDHQDGELKIGAGKGWLEILGCGMVHPDVLRNCNLDPDVYQGFAFGMGIERIAMLKYGIYDLRTFFEGDLRWLKHYGFKSYETPSLLNGLAGGIGR